MSWLSFVAAGIAGTILGHTLKFTSISKFGASRAEPITASNALFATALGVLLLDETLTSVHAIGILLVVVDVAAIAWETSHETAGDVPLRWVLVGLLFPVGDAFAYALEPVFANVGLGEGTPAPVGLVVKTIAAWLGFTLYWRWQGDLVGLTTLSSDELRWFVTAGIANTLFILGYYGSLSMTPVSLVVPIIITSSLFVIVLSMLFMPQRLERVTWKLAAAAMIVVVGV